MNEWNDEELERGLNELALLLETGPPTDVDVHALGRVPLDSGNAGGAGREGYGAYGWWRGAAVVIALVAGIAVLTIAPAREAVAQWLGIGNTTVESPSEDGAGRTPDPELPALGDDVPPLGGTSIGPAETASPASVDGADAVLGRTLPVVGGVNPATISLPEEGGVLLAYREPEVTLWIRPLDGSSLPVTKELPADNVKVVDGLGDGDALLLDADHTLRTPGRTLRSGPVVLWTADDLELRLEGALEGDQLVALAREVEVKPG
jgi:hypothetical protein